MKKLYLILSLTMTVFFILSCKKKQNETEQAEEKAELNTPTNLLKDSIYKLIFHIPEIRAFDFDLRQSTGGKKGAVILDDIDSLDSDFLYVKVGNMKKDRYQTYYRFLVNKKTLDIYAVWGDEELFTLSDWNKINDIQKIYGENSDSLQYINYLTHHYKHISPELVSRGLRQVVDTPLLKLLPLPFDLKQWNSFYYSGNMDGKENIFNYYYVKDNYVLDRILASNFFHEDAKPYIYFLLKRTNDFSIFLVLSRYEAQVTIQDKYYDIITLAGNSIESSLLAGYNPNRNEDGKSFNIDDSLKITIYDQLMCSDDARLACDTFKTTTYQITESGNIKKIKEILDENYEEIDGVIRRK